MVSASARNTQGRACAIRAPAKTGANRNMRQAMMRSVTRGRLGVLMGMTAEPRKNPICGWLQRVGSSSSSRQGGNEQQGERAYGIMGVGAGQPHQVVVVVVVVGGANGKAWACAAVHVSS